MYEIVDRHTGNVVGKAKTLRAALRSVDRRDNAYGAYRYSHRRISDEQATRLALNTLGRQLEAFLKA